MARRPKRSQRAELEAQLAKLEAVLAATFREAVEAQRAAVDRPGLVAALTAGDLERAVRALNLSPTFFAGLEEEMRRAFIDSGALVMRQLGRLRDPATGIGLRLGFDQRNPRAEAWLQLNAAGRVVEIDADQHDRLRVALREGVARGDNPRTIALDLVGRIDRSTGRRTGGIVGLHSGQIDAVDRARAELLSGESGQLRNYLRRVRRDRTCDRLVYKALRDGTGLSSADARRMIARYADRLLALRGETIARTEALAAMNNAQNVAIRQVIDTGAITTTQVRRIWRTARDSRVRHSHRNVSNQRVGLNEPFRNGLMHPGDPRGPASEIINCRCIVELDIDYFEGIT